MTLLNHLLDLDRMMISINVASQVTSSRNDDTNGTVGNVNINQRLLPLKNDTYHKSCWWKFSSTLKMFEAVGLVGTGNPHFVK